MTRRGHYPNQPQAPQELEHLQNMMHLNINIDHFSRNRNDDQGNNCVYDPFSNEAIGNLLGVHDQCNKDDHDHMYLILK